MSGDKTLAHDPRPPELSKTCGLEPIEDFDPNILPKCDFLFFWIAWRRDPANKDMPVTRILMQNSSCVAPAHKKSKQCPVKWRPFGSTAGFVSRRIKDCCFGLTMSVSALRDSLPLARCGAINRGVG